MPIIVIESSIPLPPGARSAAVSTLADAVTRMLTIEPPTQLRLRITDVAADSMAIGTGPAGGNDAPWIVAFAHLLEGRPEAVIAAFLTDFAGALATAFAVDDAHVRVLVQEYPKQSWGIGRRSAAALGR